MSWTLLTVSCQADELKLAIQADDAQLQSILQAAVTLPAGLQVNGPLNQRWLRYFQKQLPAKVSSVLEPYGFFHSQTESRLEQTGKNEYQLKVVVQAGVPVVIRTLRLELSGAGADLPILQQALQSFPLKKGDILRQDYYEQGKALILSQAVELGFLDAEFAEHQIRVQRRDNQADINLRLDSGPRYRFDQTEFTGNTNYPNQFLRRFLSYQQGEYFSQQKLNQTQQNMLNADLFEDVRITPNNNAATDARMPITISVRPAPKHRLRPGVGYGTDTGARISLRYRNLNLFNLGHEMKGDLLLAERKQTLTTTYIMPDPQRLDSRIQMRIGFDREKSDTYLSQQLFSEAEYQRTYGSNLLGAVFLRLTQDDSEVGGEKTRAQLLLPGVRLQWRQVNDPVLPDYGLQGSVEIKGAHSAFFSDTSLLQLTAESTNLLPLPKRFSLLLRLRGGTTWHNDPLRELPATLRFFAGGDRSVRGYGYQTLGPKNSSGQVVGGKHLLTANIELEKKFSENWGAAIFYDIGNAFDSFANYELEQGAGVGLRRYTAIGPIHLDLARQIGRNKNHWRLHLSLGFGW